MQNLPNFISVIRILLSFGLIFVKPFSIYFYLIYGLAGMSDFLDGFIARKYHLESDFGALLDSIADFIYMIILLIICIFYFEWKDWVLMWIIGIALIRFTSLLVGYSRYKTFCTLHTVSNKLSGLILFIFPLLLIVMPFNLLIIFICLITSLSACEELLINITSIQLNRNIPSIFHNKKVA